MQHYIPSFMARILNVGSSPARLQHQVQAFKSQRFLPYIRNECIPNYIYAVGGLSCMCSFKDSQIFKFLH